MNSDHVLTNASLCFRLVCGRINTETTRPAQLLLDDSYWLGFQSIFSTWLIDAGRSPLYLTALNPYRSIAFPWLLSPVTCIACEVPDTITTSGLVSRCAFWDIFHLFFIRYLALVCDFVKLEHSPTVASREITRQVGQTKLRVTDVQKPWWDFTRCSKAIALG